MIRRIIGWTALAAGAGALAAAAVLSIPPRDVGAVPPAFLSSAGPPPSASPVTPTVEPAAPPPALMPVSVTLPTLDVSAPVDPAGVTDRGALNVPDDPERLGWWIGSARPGDRRGTVLIAGHVDTLTDGRGALFRLERLSMGARIEVQAGDRTIVYRATARRSYAKSRLPADLFRRDTTARLALVTCGGAFRDGAYDHNVVVWAETV